jgi:UDP-N-acetylglucosamine acyltransferase
MSAAGAVHPTAVVDPSAVLGEGVEIGAYAIVGAGVVLGAGTKLLPHAMVLGPTTLGAANVVHSFAVLGGEAQHLRATSRTLIIGDRNVFREHVTVHRGTVGSGVPVTAAAGEGTTRIADEVLVMCGAHVGHDVHVGRGVVISNGVQLAGHCVVGDHVVFGGLAGVAQFVRIGESAFVAAGAMVEREVPPFLVVQGDRARVRGVNKVGLSRRGVPAESITKLERAYRLLFSKETPRATAHAEIKESALAEDPYVRRLLSAMIR